MNTFKRITVGLAAALLPIMLFSFGAYVSAYRFLESPAPVKDALQESGLYNIAVREALDAAQQNGDDGNLTSDIPIADTGVRKAIEQSVPPQLIQQQTESVIDNVFGWLQGKDSTLDFSLNLGDFKTRLADGLASYTQQHLSSLPVCQSGEGFDPNNPLQATCVPQGIDVAAASAKVRADILSNDKFLQDTELTADDLKNDNGEPLSQQLNRAPRAYEHVKQGTFVTGALAIALAAVVAFLSTTRRQGFKRVGIIALVVGAISAVFAWLAGVILQKIGQNIAVDGGTNQLQSGIVRAIDLLTADIRNWWVIYGLGLLFVGIGTIVVLRFVRQRSTPVESPKGERPDTPDVGDSNAPPATPTLLK